MNHHQPIYEQPTTGKNDPRRRPPPQANRVHEARLDWPRQPAGPNWRIPTDPPPA